MQNLTLTGLFLQAFLAATILPFSSEAGLIAALKLGNSFWPVITACSIGNCLACMVNYYLGFAFKEKAATKLNNSYGGRKALKIADRYLIPAMFLSWLPVIGDPLTVIAGIFKMDWRIFLLIVCGLRFGRYLVIACWVV